MAILRGTASSYDIGNNPPEVRWTVVRGDTAAFRVYVTDDEKQALTIADWNIEMKVKRPNNSADAGVITDEATTILTLYPAPDSDDQPGEFTVKLAASESQLLETGDIFDIELSLDQDALVWTVAQGRMIILEDVTD